jgi:AbrB family looped-hinge helix DNA binding protein
MKDMLIAIDKRGSINLPASIRKDLGLVNGAYLDIEVIKGGAVVMQPVEIFRTVRLDKQGLTKLDEARKSGVTEMPTWLSEEMAYAEPDPESKIS